MKKRVPLLGIAAGLLPLCGGLAARADYPTTVLADHPSGYWRLNSIPSLSYAANSGSAGAAANGVVGNWVREGATGALTGDANRAMQFVGAADARVTIPYTADLNPDPGAGQSFTWEAWVRSDCAKGDALGVVVNRNGESGYVVYVQGDGTLVFNLNRGPSGGYWAGATVPAESYASLVGKWFHLACVYDATGGVGFGTAMIYTNGVLCASADIPDAPPVVNDGGPMTLGDRNFVGCLDEVAVYPSALSASTLLSHYQASGATSGGYTARVLAGKPVGYWRLGETNGAASPPSLGANAGSLGASADGTYSAGSTLQVAGVLGGADKAATFAGGTLTVPQHAALNPNGPFTIEAWLRPATAQSGSSLVCAMSSMEVNDPRAGWLIYQSASGWNFRTYNQNSTATAVNITGGSAPAAGTWYHVAAVWDGSIGTIYVNGVPTASAATNYVPTGFRNLTLGGRSDGGYLWSGTMDEVAFYPRALGAAAVAAHYQAATTNATGYGAQILAEEPVGYWRLDDQPVAGSGAVNLGYIGSAGNGVFNGTAIVVSSDTPLVGDSDKALYFPGSGRIDIPLHEALVRTNVFSYEIWYKEDGGTSGIRSPLWWRDEPTAGDTRGWVHYLMDLDGGRGHAFQSSSTATTWDGMTVTPTTFAQDTWQHLVCTFDGRVKKIYLDAALVQVSTNDPRYVKPVQRPTCTISSASYPFVGFLDEAAYYTNALSADRVLAHYVAARGANPPAMAPVFKVDASGVSGYEGATIKVPTVILGTPPFTYRWYKGATVVASQNSDTLTLSPAKETDSGDYKLVVSNAGGSAESQTVTVQIQKAPPTITKQPAAMARLEGASATFTVQAGGTEPLSYQWHSNNVAIAGANEASLTLKNLQPSFAAEYSVVITNVAGTAQSQTARLSVASLAAGGFAAAVVANQPVAYWRLDETSGTTAHDYVGGYDGAYDTSVTLGQPGALVGDANKSAAFLYGGIVVPHATALNPPAAFSLEAWVKIDPAGAGTDRPILRSINSYAGWAYGYSLFANSSDAWSFTSGQKTSGFDTLTGGSTASEGWTHLICTLNDATGEKRLYVNGQLAAETTTAPGTYAPSPTEGTPDNPVPFDQGIGYNVNESTCFVGGLDEVALYNYALSASQVEAHYAKGMGLVTAPTLTIAPSQGKAVLTWSQGFLLEADEANGPWTTNSAASSPWTVTPTRERQFYRIIIPR